MDHNYRFATGEDNYPRTDAPQPRLYTGITDKGWWHFEHHTICAGHCPSHIPGDLDRVFPSLAQAANAALDYYFGDPSAMNPPDVLQQIENERNRLLELEEWNKKHRRTNMRREMGRVDWFYVKRIMPLQQTIWGRFSRMTGRTMRWFFSIKYLHLRVQGWRVSSALYFIDDKGYLEFFKIVRRQNLDTSRGMPGVE